MDYASTNDPELDHGGDSWRLFDLEGFVASPLLSSKQPLACEQSGLNQHAEISPDIDPLGYPWEDPVLSLDGGDNFNLPGPFLDANQSFPSHGFSSLQTAILSHSGSYGSSLGSTLEDHSGHFFTDGTVQPCDVLSPQLALSAIMFSQAGDETFPTEDVLQQPIETSSVMQWQPQLQQHSASCPPLPIPVRPVDHSSAAVHAVRPSTFDVMACHERPLTRDAQTPAAEPIGIRKRRKGRKGPLSDVGKEQAALIRRMKACSACRDRKAKCDPGMPCKPCIKRFKSALLWNRCRGFHLPDIIDVFFAEELAWHPSSRSPTSFFGPNMRYSAQILEVPITLGFGPGMLEKIRVIWPADRSRLSHHHVVYQWPPSGQTATGMHGYEHFTFPGMLADTQNLAIRLDAHLSILLEEENFKDFPCYHSEFKILAEIYKMYLHLGTKQESGRLLHQVLKLLVLVHSAGDVGVELFDDNVQLILSGTRTFPNSTTTDVTACAIRGQFGSVIPSLARHLMKSVLDGLYHVMLLQNCDRWPLVISTFAVLLMVIETMQYHSAKVGFHAGYDGRIEDSPAHAYPATCRALDEEAVNRLLHLYRICYGDCHARLMNERAPLPQDGSGDFLKTMRNAVGNASTYLDRRSTLTLSQINDMSFFFDRLLAKLFLSQ